jgi:hypothetical protein
VRRAPDGGPTSAIVENLRFQSAACEQLGSPLYAGLLSRAAADFEARGPTWEVLHNYERDPRDSALGLRLMGAVNRLVLRGDEPAVAAVYGDSDPDPTAAWRAFSATLDRNTQELRQLIEMPVQTNEVGRCAPLLAGFLTVADETGLPLRLLEVGSSAGLNLRWDRYRYSAKGFAWGPDDSPARIEFELQGDGRFPTPPQVEVAERRGCDAAPVDPSTPEGRLTLLAYVWPDQPARIERMRAALEVAAATPVAVDAERAGPWVRRKLGESGNDLATVLYHSIVFQYLSEEERATFQSLLREAAERATVDAPLAWLRMEPAGERADVRLTVWPAGEDRHIARAGYHGSPVELLH